MITIIYRGIAVSKNIPVVLGYQTKEKFLRENLNFSFGDFYDVDGYFAHHISANDKVLLYGFHNLYYVNFPFIDSSWVKKGDTFSYIATQHAALPMQFSHWTAIYHNETTDVTLYKNGDRLWMY
ncbi:MAG: hypothetical protein HY430_04265, partial [Candidatus Levybacteria bacterium]|nr:hypothetical protein [Candidatus Levybacteria bacterium]